MEYCCWTLRDKKSKIPNEILPERFLLTLPQVTGGMIVSPLYSTLIVFCFSTWVVADEVGSQRSFAGSRAAIPIAGEIQESPLFRGQQEAGFALSDGNGNTPEIELLTKHRRTAWALTLAANGTGEYSIRMRFVGLVFRVDPTDSQMVIVNMVGKNREVQISKRISRALLEGGERIRIDLPTKVKSLLGNKVRGSGNLSFRFNPKSGEIEALSATGSIKVEAFSTIDESREITGVTGRRHNLQRMPVQREDQ